MPEVGEIEEIVRARFWMVDLLFLEINSFHFFVIKKTAKIIKIAAIKSWKLNCSPANKTPSEIATNGLT